MNDFAPQRKLAEVRRISPDNNTREQGSLQPRMAIWGSSRHTTNNNIIHVRRMNQARHFQVDAGIQHHARSHVCAESERGVSQPTIPSITLRGHIYSWERHCKVREAKKQDLRARYYYHWRPSKIQANNTGFSAK